MSAETPTIPAPRDDDTLALCRELRAAAERMGELAAILVNRLTLAEISILTNEHRQHVVEARCDKLAELSDDTRARVEKLEEARVA